MNFTKAMDYLNMEEKVKLPEWTGYWFKPDLGEGYYDNIKVMTASGDVLDTPYLDDYKNRTDWEITDGSRDFGGALKALKAGKRLTRKGWNGKGLFVFMQIPSEISMDIVPKMQSLPQSVKDEFQRRFDNSKLKSISYENQLAIVNTENVIKGWAPSVSDSLAEDWIVIE